MKYANDFSHDTLPVSASTPDVCEQRLSALMDGHLDLAQTQALLHADQQDSQQDDDLLQTWASYHVVGDALRSHWADHALDRAVSNPAANTPAQAALVVAVAPVPAISPNLSAAKNAANDSVFRWRLVAGIAAVAAVGSIIWSLAGTQPGISGAQLAQQNQQPTSQSGPQQTDAQPVSPATGPATVVASAIETAAPPAVMLRDPRLDELLAAHKQFGNASALQQPAGFLRNATFVPSSR